MKTSNKLLTGAFIIILIIMITSNFYVKHKIGKIKNDIKNTEQIQETDTLKNDSTINIKINIK